MISPMRRVTLPTIKMEETIQFYTDVLGMKTFYDQIMVPESGTQSLLGPEGNAPHRLVSLQQGDSTVGMLGLLDYMQPELGIKPFEKKPGMPYPIIIIFLVDDVKEIATKVRNSGYKIIGGPQKWEIPGKGPGAGMSFLDPNGILVELTQLPSRDPDQRGPISPIRRVTIPVAKGKMGESIRFYQKALGMKVYYDNVVVTDLDKSLLGIPGIVKTRLVSLQQGENRFGMVGLLEYFEPEMEVKPFVKRPGYPYEVIFVFVVDDMEDVLSKATALGSTVLARKTYNIPQRGKADGAMITDPNGVVIDLTQWL